MKRTRILALICCFMVMFSQNAFAYKYSVEDYTHYTGDRLDAKMPGEFSVDNLSHQTIATEDFADSVFLNLEHSSGSYSLDGDGTLKLEKTQTQEAHQVVFNVLKGNHTYTPGDYYLFTCRMKTGDDFTAGKAKSILTVYSSVTNKWSQEASSLAYQDTNGWETLYQVLQLPENSGTLKLSAYIEKSATGTVWFDDFALYRVMFDPMRTVLCKPAYKGFIYGDGVGDIDLDILVNEYSGFYAYDDIMLETVLTNEQGAVVRSSAAETVSHRMNMVFSSKGLPEGDYYLTTRLMMKNGALLSEKEHTIRKRSADYRPDTYIDENGHLVQNGEKTFHKQIIGGSHSGYGSTNIYAAEAERISGTAIDSVSHQGYGWWLTTNEVATTAALERMRSEEKTLGLKLASFIHGRKNDDAQLTLLQEPWHGRSLFTLVANEYKNDPILGGYYIFDEPNPLTQGEEIGWYNDVMAEVDPDHFTFGAADKNFDDYGMYTSMVDVVYIDPYPVYGLATDNISVVGKSIKEMKESFPNRPVGYIMQGFNWNDAGRTANRPPTYAELRNMLYQALCEGAEGLDCYSLPMMEFGTGKTWDAWKTEIYSLYDEAEQYEDILMSDEPAPRYHLKEASWLNHCVRRSNGKTYLFAVNNSNAAQETSITIPGATTCETEEGTTVAVNNGSAILSFAPLEVKILAFTQEDYVSPEAELKQLGFYNNSTVYPVAEGDTHILYVTDNSVIVSYCADISDGATLYIDGSVKPCMGKINVKDADSFIVTVQSEDNKTKTSVKYEIRRQQ